MTLNLLKFAFLIASLVLIQLVFVNTEDSYLNEEEKHNLNNSNCSFLHELLNLKKDASFIGKYKHAAVATDSIICSKIGKDILLVNGSAVDAAIATGLCNGVVNPQSMGIGGGHMMMIYLRESKKMIAIDSREVAPLNATETMLLNNSKTGLLTGVPGEIAGYWAAHQIGGKLPWKKLFEPTINICKNGFNVSYYFSQIISYAVQLSKNKAFKSIFTNPLTNKTYMANEILKFPQLAKTFEEISENGYQEFYSGNLSVRIIAENTKMGGILTEKDLKNYKPLNRRPIQFNLKNKKRLFTLPPPSSGVLVGFIMNVMSKFNLNNTSNAIFYHRFAETLKHAYAQRAFLGDESFVDMNRLIKILSSDNYAEETYKLVKDYETFNQSYYGKSWPSRDDFGTAHLAVLAPNGDAVSLTASVNTIFGAKYAGESSGIIYNDVMDDFSSPGINDPYRNPSAEPNYIRPGKRPMSSMAPIIVLDENDDVKLILGGSGGMKIISGVSQVAIGILLSGQDIKKATDKIRLHTQLYPNTIELERGLNQKTLEDLSRRGHKFGCLIFIGANIQSIERRSKHELWANSDYRKTGRTEGF